MARPRDTIAGQVRLILDTQDATPLHPSGTTDARLISLVQLLARQAARDFVNAELEAAKGRDLQK